MTSHSSNNIEPRIQHFGRPLLGTMAEDSEEHEGAHEGAQEAVPSSSQSHEGDTADETETEDRDSDEDEDEGEEEEDDEPKLKYARMTGHLTQVYRNGDATSCFLVAGDKMVC